MVADVSFSILSSMMYTRLFVSNTTAMRRMDEIPLDHGVLEFEIMEHIKHGKYQAQHKQRQEIIGPEYKIQNEKCQKTKYYEQHHQ